MGGCDIHNMDINAHFSNTFVYTWFDSLVHGVVALGTRVCMMIQCVFTFQVRKHTWSSQCTLLSHASCCIPILSFLDAPLIFVLPFKFNRGLHFCVIATCFIVIDPDILAWFIPTWCGEERVQGLIRLSVCTSWWLYNYHCYNTVHIWDKVLVLPFHL